MSAKTSKVAIMDRYPDAARATRPILWPRVRQYTVSDSVGGVLVAISYSSGVHTTPAGIWGFAMTVLASGHLAYSNQAPFAQVGYRGLCEYPRGTSSRRPIGTARPTISEPA
jgi:hypothetical protein